MGISVIVTFYFVALESLGLVYVREFAQPQEILMCPYSRLCKFVLALTCVWYLLSFRYFRIKEQRADSILISIFLVVSTFWVYEMKVQRKISFFDSMNASWYREFIPTGCLLLGGNRVGGISCIYVLLLWTLSIVFSPWNENASIVISNVVLLITTTAYHNSYTETAYAEVVHAYEDAKKANETKTVFMAKMSHDLRTPLNGLMGFISELMELPHSPSHRELLEIIQTCAEGLERIIVDLLDVSLIEMGKVSLVLSDFNLEGFLHSLKILCDDLAKRKNRHLKFFFDPSLPRRVRGDSVRIHQILINLINNSIKFTDDNGNIEVYVERGMSIERDSPKIRINFRVTDDGIGIPKHVQPYLFTPFFQHQSQYSSLGSGLGLYICKRMSVAMGGDIDCVNVKQGCEFQGWIELDPPVTQEEVNLIEEDELNVKGATILIAEDNPVNVKLLVRILGGLGISHLVAKNGNEAVELYKCHKSSISLILMDIQMPELNGIEATKLIRSQGKEKRVPIIAVTAGVTKREIKTLKEAGLDDYLPKPIKKPKLKEILRKWIQS